MSCVCIICLCMHVCVHVYLHKYVVGALKYLVGTCDSTTAVGESVLNCSRDQKVFEDTFAICSLGDVSRCWTAIKNERKGVYTAKAETHDTSFNSLLSGWPALPPSCLLARLSEKSCLCMMHFHCSSRSASIAQPARTAPLYICSLSC
jgi:hypothetical protein